MCCVRANLARVLMRARVANSRASGAAGHSEKKTPLSSLVDQQLGVLQPLHGRAVEARVEVGVVERLLGLFLWVAGEGEGGRQPFFQKRSVQSTNTDALTHSPPSLPPLHTHREALGGVVREHAAQQVDARLLERREDARQVLRAPLRALVPFWGFLGVCLFGDDVCVCGMREERVRASCIGRLMRRAVSAAAAAAQQKEAERTHTTCTHNKQKQPQQRLPVAQARDAGPERLVGRAEQLEDVQQLLPLRVAREERLLLRCSVVACGFGLAVG